MRTLTCKMGIFSAVRYSPDGRSLVSLHSRRYLRFWDLATFEERLYHALRLGQFGYHGLLSLGGTLLALDNTLYQAADVWNLLRQPPGRRVRAPLAPVELARPAGENALLLTPDGKTIVGVGDHVTVWKGPEVRQKTFSAGGLRYWRSNAGAGLALSPDGCLVAGCHDSDVRVYDVLAGKEVGKFSHTDRTQKVCFSTDSRRLAAGAGRTLYVWDVAGKECLARFPAFRRYCISLAFHPSRPLLAAGGREGEVRLIDTGTLKESARFDWDVGAIHDLAFSPDGTTAAAAGHNATIAVWDLD